MKNFKINTNRPPLTDADLSSGKDFGQLMKSYNAMKTPFFKTAKFWFGSGAALVTTVAAVVILSQTLKKDSVNEALIPPFINPPIVEADIKSAVYVLEAEKDSIIDYITGSQILVPANAFLDESGNVVKGKVELSYREFHNVADVFLAGIPMTYDSAGETYHFETAGMMEIAATQNGKPLHTNPSALIQVKMVSDKKEDRFNTYYLDTTKKRWEYVSESNFIKNEEPLTANAQEPVTETKPKKNNKKLSGDEALKQQSAEYRQLCQAVEDVEKEKPVAPKKAEKKKARFSIKVDEKEFPELAEYNNLKFEVVNEKEYDPKQAQVLWEDVQMKRAEGSMNYEITFSKGKTSYSIIATPALEDKDYDAAKKVFDAKYKDYEIKLAQRKAEQQRLKEELEARASAMEEKIKREIEAQQMRIKEYEAKMEQSNLFFRMFRVQNFGTMNCDQPQRLPVGATVQAKFTDKSTGKELDLQCIYLVEANRGIMYTYYPGKPTNLRFNPVQENLVWALTTDQQVCIIKKEDFRSAAKNSGRVEFPLEVLNQKFGSTEEVKNYLGI